MPDRGSEVRDPAREDPSSHSPASGLSEWEFQREVLRFLRKAGGRLPRDLRVAIVRAIHEGRSRNRGVRHGTTLR